MPELNDKDRADLVAYLDGELGEGASRTLETRLNQDPKARAELEALRRTWELLDYLPRPEPTPGFTHRTLERVSALRPAALDGRFRKGWPRWLTGLGWAAAVAVAAAGGFLSVRFLGLAGEDRSPPDPLAHLKPAEVENYLVRNLRILENKRLYEDVDDIEFLKALDDPDLFGEPEGGG